MNGDGKISVTDELIVKFLAGEASPDEAMALADWLEAAGNKAHFEALSSTWYKSGPQAKLRDIDKDKAWQRVQPATTIPGPATRGTGGTGYLLRIAAAILLLIASGAIVYQLTRNPETPMITKVTSTETETITLEDHSSVTLDRNSRLTFPKEFKGNQRPVNLISGQAYFVIAPNQQQPFVVGTSVASIQVVGTEFNVSLKAEHLSVSVTKGKVMVYNAQDTVYLTPGQTATVHATMGEMAISGTAHPNDWGYATRRLNFEDVPIKRVISDIEAAYPYTIRLSNKDIENCKLTATFDNESTENILTLIAESLNLTVERDGNAFELKGEGCP